VLLVSKFILLGVLALVLIPHTAMAQTQPPVLKAGEAVWVTTRDGRQVNGRVQSSSTSELVVVYNSQMTPLRWTDIRAIDGNAPDSIVNGTAIGGAIGGLGGGIGSLLIMNLICSECENGEDAKTIGFVSVGIGAGIGAFIDSQRHGRKTLYRSASLSIVPAMGRRQIGIGVVARW
jgi:hypothetical protein